MVCKYFTEIAQVIKQKKLQCLLNMAYIPATGHRGVSAVHTLLGFVKCKYYCLEILLHRSKYADFARDIDINWTVYCGQHFLANVDVNVNVYIKKTNILDLVEILTEFVV